MNRIMHPQDRTVKWTYHLSNRDCCTYVRQFFYARGMIISTHFMYCTTKYMCHTAVLYLLHEEEKRKESRDGEINTVDRRKQGNSQS